MDKYLARVEKTTANAVYRALQQDKKEIQNLLRSFDTTKGFLDTLESLLSRLGKRVVDAFIPRVKTTMKRAGETVQKQHSEKIPDFSIDFSIATRPEAVYIGALEGLHLSQRQGSISTTTTERVRSAVVRGTKEGLTYSQIADQIERLDPQVFSRNRAELIAINQVGKAYQFGEYTAMREIHRSGYLVLKYWSTVNDNRVTPTHTANQNEGWKDLDEAFGGTGDLMPPASDNPRCRCALTNRVGNKRGEEQTEEMQALIIARDESRKTNQFLTSLRASYDRETPVPNTDRIRWYEQVNEDEKLGLTQEELASIYTYKSHGYTKMNASLRERKIDPSVQGSIILFDEALGKLQLSTGTVWRGVKSGNRADAIRKIEIGDILHESGFLSASKVRHIANEFSSYGESEGIVMQITSKSGRSLGSLDSMGEEEILFSPGKNLQLTKIDGSTYFFTEL